MSTLIFGHKNPDTDSVASAIAFAELKNKLGINCEAVTLGEINKETEFILNHFEIDKPRVIDNVKIQVKDIEYDKVPRLNKKDSILYAYKLMDSENLKTLPVVNEAGRLKGIVSMKAIAMAFIKGDIYKVKTSLSNMIEGLEANVLSGEEGEIEGKIHVIAYYSKTLKTSEILNEDSIVIVGDRYEVIEHAIDKKVAAIIITGGNSIPKELVLKARENSVIMISTEKDTYETSKLIERLNYVSITMKKHGVIEFDESEYLEDVKEEIISSNHSNYPVINSNKEFLGFINKKHILNPDRKKVILVDHNEYSQSANGLNEAEIIEVIDHHKIGDISTSLPINFRNMTVGSTCTIIYKIYKEANVLIDDKMAGLLLSGIMSDTLALKSPTTTDFDRKVIEELKVRLNMDVDSYVKKMFKKGTSLKGQDIKDVIFKDFKEFNVDTQNIGVGQVFTMDIDEIFNQSEEVVRYIQESHVASKNYITLILVTDILKEGSYVFYASEDKHILKHVFEREVEQGTFVEGVVSRKKQVVPNIIKNMEVQ